MYTLIVYNSSMLETGSSLKKWVKRRVLYCPSKKMVAKRFELLHLTIPEDSMMRSVLHIRFEPKLLNLESGALARSAKQPLLMLIYAW